MNNDIVQTLEHLAESTRVLDQLRRMPKERVAYLIGILENPAAVESLLRLLRTVGDLEKENRFQQMGPNLFIDESRPGRSSSSMSELARELPIILNRMFSDKSRFPTVKSIGDFVHNAFRIAVPYERLSRERYTRKVTNAVRRSPKALHFARNNMMHQPATTHDEAYAALYKFIRGRLTD